MFDIYSADATQTYLQSLFALNKNVFLKTGIMWFTNGDRLQPVKPINDLTDSGKYRHKSLEVHQK